MTTPISVAVIGFSVPEKHKFKKIFTLSQSYKRAYQLLDVADIDTAQLLIVKTIADLEDYRARYSKNNIPAVKVAKESSADDDIPSIKGILIPSRIFEVLDKVDLCSETAVSLQQTEQNAVLLSSSAAVINPTALQVLVVDDSLMMQKIIQLELEKTTPALAVDFAESGEIALEKAAVNKYDFVFLDVMMSGIDGFETCQRMRHLAGMAKTPIIMLTSKTSITDEVKGLMAGCTTYLTKPFEPNEFQKMLERIMRWLKEFNN